MRKAAIVSWWVLCFGTMVVHSSIVCATAYAQGLAVLKLPAKALGEVGEPIPIKAETIGNVVKWYVMDAGLKQFPPELLTDRKTGVFYSARPGNYRVMAYTAVKDEPSDPVICLVVVGTPGPAPFPPPDPGPTPPPDPKPIPTPTGFRVMFVFETQVNMTKEQTNIMNSTKINAYLNAKCVKDSNGRPAWRKWDKNTPKESELLVWKQLWDASNPSIKSLPSIVIANNERAEVFVMPATEAETLALLKSKGGE